jgi:hypothetical protein
VTLLKSLTLTSVKLTHVTFQVSSNRPKGIQLPLAGVPMPVGSQEVTTTKRKQKQKKKREKKQKSIEKNKKGDFSNS